MITASNPFSTRFVRPGALGYAFGGDRDGRAETARANQWLVGLAKQLHQVRRGLIVGPHGTGKSTLLRSLRPFLRSQFSDVASVTLTTPVTSRPWDRWRRASQNGDLVHVQQAALSRGGLLIVDGAEQLTPLVWWRLRSSADRQEQAILATSHRSLRGIGVLHRTENSAELIRDLTLQLVSPSSRRVRQLVAQALAERELTPQSNVRDLWFDLYDVVQPHLCGDGSGDEHPAAAIDSADALHAAEFTSRCSILQPIPNGFGSLS